MSYTQVLISTGPGNSVQSTVINSTKVRVTANVPTHYAVGVNPICYQGNCELIPANSIKYINMQGLGNKIAIMGSSSTSEVSITQIGNVAPSGITSSSDTYRQS
jgi:hypothetical protein